MQSSAHTRSGRKAGRGLDKAGVRMVVAALAALCFSCPQGLAAEPTPLFTPAEVAAYEPKGPSKCFRHICLEYNSVTRRKRVFTPAELKEFFSDYDPVEYAQFCKDIHLDAALMLAVPQGGHTAYLQTKVGEPYPWLKENGRDFFGEVTRELHKQGIASLGYIIIGWNIKYANEHPEVSFGWYPLICLNSPYTDLICDYSREVLTHYPIDGLRYDILDQPTQCRCKDCKAFYRQLFGDQMPEKWKDWQTETRFRIESTTRSMRRIYETCKKTKPSVEVWQNWFNDRGRIDLRSSKYVDLAYLEFADPFRELFLNGVFDKGGIITGKILRSHSTRRMCLALGGRCYPYFPVDAKTALPNDAVLAKYGAHKNPKSSDWFKQDLAPFYAMVTEVESYLLSAKPVPYFGIVYSEATRFRTHGFDRAPHMKLLRALAEPYLGRSMPPEFIAAEHLSGRDLSQFKLLVLPESSGLPEDAHKALVEYVREGGQLLATGGALLYDDRGKPREDFALAEALGVSHEGMLPGSGRWRWSNHIYGGKRVTLRIDQPGKRTFHVWMREGGSRIDRFVLTTDLDYVPTGRGPAADANKDATPRDLIVLEAEAFSENTPRNKCSWQVRSDADGFVGKEFMQATPTVGKKLAEDYETTSPEMRYPIEFKKPGIYYVWVRQTCDSTSQDSIHIGLDGKGLGTYDFNTTTAEGSRIAGPTTQPRELSPLKLDAEQVWPRESIRGSILVVQPTAGRTAVFTTGARGQRLPILHLNELGKGRIAYLAGSDDTDLLRHAIDAMVGCRPLTVTPEGKQAILTRQQSQHRWILHLMHDGEYTVEIHRDFAAPTRVVGQYPDKGWSYEASKTGTGLRITVRGDARDRLLVLQ